MNQSFAGAGLKHPLAIACGRISSAIRKTARAYPNSETEALKPKHSVVCSSSLFGNGEYAVVLQLPWEEQNGSNRTSRDSDRQCSTARVQVVTDRR